MKELLKKIEWVNFLYIVGTPIVAMTGTIWVFLNGGPHWATWILMAAMMMATGMSITAGYHRLFSHQTYKTSPLIKALLLFFGGAAFEGSAREWACQHRKHHRFVDTEKDPYNIKQGFWYAHVLWVIFKADESDVSNIKDLLKDPLIAFQHRFYLPLAILGAIGIPTFLASLWGDVWGGLFIGGFLALVLNNHLTFLINSAAHTFGKQTYSDATSGCDSWLLAFFTYGEGFHNFHHAFEADYRNGIRAHHFDPSKWLIRFFSWFGLTWHLKRSPDQKILEAKLVMDEKRLKLKLERKPGLYADWVHLLEKARQNVEQVHIQLLDLKIKYQKLKSEKAESVAETIEHVKQEIERVKNEFQLAMNHWQALINGKLNPQTV